MTVTEEILVLSATAFEQLALREAVVERVQRKVAEREWVSGKIGTQPVTLVATGIGAVNAAHALTCYLQGQRPLRVVQVGVGGAYPASGASVGDLALASEECYGDLGVRTPDGWQGGELIGIPVLEKERSYYNCFPIDEQWVQRAATALPEAYIGPFVTVQECAGTDELGAERGRRFGALCENMEGAAAAHLCALYEVPFAELRAMSNIVEQRTREQWDLPRAAARAQAAAQKLLEEGLCA